MLKITYALDFIIDHDCYLFFYYNAQILKGSFIKLVDFKESTNNYRLGR